MPNAESLVIRGGATPVHPTANVAPARLRARGLVNTGNMCLTNSVFQLLLHLPLIWNLLRELGDLKGLRGARGPETAGGAVLYWRNATGMSRMLHQSHTLWPRDALCTSLHDIWEIMPSVFAPTSARDSKLTPRIAYKAVPLFYDPPTAHTVPHHHF